MWSSSCSLRAFSIRKVGNLAPLSTDWSYKSWKVVRRAVHGSSRPTGQTPAEVLQRKHGGGPSSSTFQQKGKFLKKAWVHKAGAGWTFLFFLDWLILAAGNWLTWRGVFLRWTPLGICLVAAAHWHSHNRDCDKKGVPRTATHWQVRVFHFNFRFKINRFWFYSCAATDHVFWHWISRHCDISLLVADVLSSLQNLFKIHFDCRTEPKCFNAIGLSLSHLYVRTT